MTITTSNYSESEYTRYIEVSDGTRSLWINETPEWNEIRICVKNAAHKAWRGLGRAFPSYEAALDAYKSEAVKQMIDEGRREIAARA